MNRPKNVRTDICVLLHYVEFIWRQPAGLVQNEFGNRELAHVMQEGGCFDSLDLYFIVDAHRSR